MVGLRGGGTFPFSYGVMPHATTIGYTFGGSLSDLAEVVALAESGRVEPEVQKFPFDQIDLAYHELHDGKIQGRGVISSRTEVRPMESNFELSSYHGITTSANPLPVPPRVTRAV